jgi:hypothetical protein
MAHLLPRIVAAVFAAAWSGVPAAMAQERPSEFESWTVPGWTFTPSVSVGGQWDSNVAIAADQPRGTRTGRDRLWVFEPQGLLEFRDNRTTFSAGYRGHLRRYLEVDQLNGLDHRASVSLERMATKRVTVFFRNEFADVPTTDEVLLNGIPYARTGSRSNRLAAGLDARLTKYDDLAVRYENTWVSFDEDTVFLRGGVLNEVRFDYGRRLSPRATLGGEYRVRQSNMNEGTRVMWFHDIGAVAEFAASPQVTLQAAGGYSMLRDPRLTDARGGAYLRAELTRDGERSTTGLFFERAFAPSFGFGGSSESQELRGYVHMPFSRNRLYVQASAGWRRTSPLLADELGLDTFLADTTVGYGASRWLRLEVFHAYTRQDSRITGGEINRHRAGAQVVVSQPMRIR